MFTRSSARALAVAGFASHLTHSLAYDIDVAQPSSVEDAATAVASNAFSYYHGNKPGGVPGIINERPFNQTARDFVYWWESAALFDGLINLWSNTQDSQYNGAIEEGILFQIGDNMDFQPQNETQNLGNDDQAYWALCAMTAEERGLPLLKNANTTYLRLAQSVADIQAARWDSKTCDGGLRWQTNPVSAGYDYKSSAANAVFFQLAARLYRFTKNETYADLATRSYDWMTKVGLVDEKRNFAVYDGTRIEDQCSSISRQQFSDVASTMMYGAAVLANATGSNQWHDRTMGFATGFNDFFTNGTKDVLYEVPCENIGTCNNDMKVYKGLASLASSLTTVMAPYTADTLRPMLEASAQGAAAACTKESCGFSWTAGKNDGDTGVSQSIAAMDVLTALLTRSDLTFRTSTSPPVPESNQAFGNSTATSDDAPKPTMGPDSSATITPVSSSSDTNAASSLVAGWQGALALVAAAVPLIWTL